MGTVMKVRCAGIAVVAMCVGMGGCNRNQEQPPEQASQATGPDPADANLASPDQTGRNTAQNQAPAASAPPASQPAYSQAPAPQQASQQSAPQPSYEPPPANQSAANENYASYNDQPVEASQPPPPLPEYTQPPCPGEDYIWTPGSWGYAQSGYYWVPGAWVIAPFVGALWTPPYWAFEGGRYRWNHGYWGSHIGFYGGVNYGFGYTGRGFYGGYWSGRDFHYNRAVTNVNVREVHNVYNHVVNNVTVNRISYNGGRGGIEQRPIPAELAAERERRVAPVPAQIQHQRAANCARLLDASR